MDDKEAGSVHTLTYRAPIEDRVRPVRAWNSIYIGTYVIVITLAPQLFSVLGGDTLIGKGQTIGAVVGCTFFVLLLGGMIAGISSAVRSLREGPFRRVAFIGLMMNLSPIWLLYLLNRLDR
jgi:hypothetical protein